MIDVEKNGEHVVITPDPSSFTAQQGEFNKILEKLVGEGCLKITIDFEFVEMIDSKGLGVLITTQNKLKENSGDLEIINVNRSILKLFTLMRLDKHFTVRSN